MAEPTPTDAELTECYKAANGEDVGKAQPLTTQRIFRAMRAAIARWGAQPAPAASQKPPTQVQAGAVPLTERQIAQCIVSAGCVGTVKMSFESGPYSIDRPTLNATKLVQSIEAAHGIGIKGGRNVDHPV